jgi:hypothetical protein
MDAVGFGAKFNLAGFAAAGAAMPRERSRPRDQVPRALIGGASADRPHA